MDPAERERLIHKTEIGDITGKVPETVGEEGLYNTSDGIALG